MAALHVYRLVTFGVILILSLVILGLSGYIYGNTTSGFEDYFGDIYSVQVHYVFAALGIAVGVLTLITVGPMLALDFFLPGLFTSHIWFELVVLGVLWVLWLATGGEAAAAVGSFDCSLSAPQICGEFGAVAAFGFIGWLALMAYTITLLVTTVRAAQAGNKAWTTSVRHGFETPNPARSGAPQANSAPANAYPMQQQGYPPSQPLSNAHPQEQAPAQTAYNGEPQSQAYAQHTQYTQAHPAAAAPPRAEYYEPEQGQPHPQVAPYQPTAYDSV